MYCLHVAKISVVKIINQQLMSSAATSTKGMSNNFFDLAIVT